MITFVDASILVALAIPQERKHEEAGQITSLIGPGEAFTTDHAVVEAWHLINNRSGRFRAMQFWFGLREAPLFVEFTTHADLERAEAIARSWPDQDFDLVDCTSFAVMERVGCNRAATFDRDFAVYRYGVDRTKAFEILG